MAKARKGNTGMPVLERDSGAARFSGETMTAKADQERIAERAYQLYMERGGSDGRDLDDWLEAERELARRTGQRDQAADSGA